MSDHQVLVVRIDAIKEHPNADRLELATIFGWQCVVGKGVYKAGDKVVYIPIDSVLPWTVESKLFPPGSKITLKKARVRTIKIRGEISQGMVAPLEDLCLPEDIPVGTDVMMMLEIKKWEPPASSVPSRMRIGKQTNKRESNPYFHKYTNLNNVKYYPGALEEHRVVITEKIHGTNFRAGWVPFHATNVFQSMGQWMFGWLGMYHDQFCYGSHNVQLQNKILYSGFYDQNVYAEIAHRYELDSRLPRNTIVFGEIFGDGIQKGYNYGLTNGEIDFVVFDVMQYDRFLAHDETVQFCEVHDLPMVPILYEGPYFDGLVDRYIGGPSLLDPSQKVREGCVIKPVYEQHGPSSGRLVLKCINPDYLLKDQSEFH